MTKRERAEMEELRSQLRMARAFHFTTPVEPDVPPPSGMSDGLTEGFLYNAYERAWRVVPACSSSVGHSFGCDDRTDSQNPSALFSTRLLALQALRNDAEKQCARWLAEIDQAIEKAERDSTTTYGE